MKPVAEPEYIDPRPTSKMAGFLLFVLVLLYVGRSHEALALRLGVSLRFNLLFIVVTFLFCAPWLLKNPLKYLKRSIVLRRVAYYALWVTAMIPFSRWPGGSVEALIGFLKIYGFIFLAAAMLMRFRLTSIGVFSYVISVLITLLFSVIFRSDSVRVSTITGTYDPNEMALIAVIILPIIFFSIRNSKPFMKVFWSGGLALCVMAVALSGSRGGALGLGVVGTYILFVSSISKSKKMLAVIVTAVVFLVAVPQENLLRLTKTVDIENDYNLTEKGGRINLWITDLKKIAKNPVNGVGLGMSAVLEEGEDSKWMVAHNSYIQMALEGGLPGFLILFSVMLICKRRLSELRRILDKRDRRLALVYGLEGGLWGYLVCVVFLSVAFHALSLYFYIIIEAFYKDIKGQYLVPVAPPEPSPRQSGPRLRKKRSYTMRQVGH